MHDVEQHAVAFEGQSVSRLRPYVTIDSIHIERFRQITRQQYVLHNGLTVIRGENERGKSTLLASVLAAFFINPTRRNRQIEGFRQWGNEQLPRIQMRFTVHRGVSEQSVLFKRASKITSVDHMKTGGSSQTSDNRIDDSEHDNHIDSHEKTDALSEHVERSNHSARSNAVTSYDSVKRLGTYELVCDMEEKVFSLTHEQSSKQWSTAQEAESVLREVCGTTDPFVWLATTVLQLEIKQRLRLRQLKA